MTILDKIIAHKKLEVQQNKQNVSIADLENTLHFKREVYSISEALKRSDSSGIIAEFKRKSPSKGIINDQIDVVEQALNYKKNNVAAMSVLTDKMFFGGNNSDLMTARNFIDVPILRKDFVVDEYQIIEAKAIGADFVLLIASVLSKKQIAAFADFAHNLGLEVLCEVHNEKELEKLNSRINLVGVNNRNLNDFSVSLENSINLSKKIPKEYMRISESGISSKEDIELLRKYGFQGFLIGEYFMRAQNMDL